MHPHLKKSLIALLLLSTLFCPASIAAENLPLDSTLIYVGTYTGPKSKGIYLFRFQTPRITARNNQTPTFLPLGLAAEVASPSFLTVDLNRHLLFAVNEVDKLNGKPTGAVSSFTMDPETGLLTLLNQQPSMGAGPCHLLLDKAGKNLLVANYGSGTVAVLPVDSTGHLGDPTSVIQHTGRSVDPKRQEGPHAHCVALDPANQFAFVCDLGLDRVMIYHFDSTTGKLTPNNPPFAPIKPGSGPRHITFRPDGKFAYVNNEMSSTVTVFAYAPTSGRLTELQTITTLPENFAGNSSTAEIAIHPSGKFLYVSNRGRDSLAYYAIDPEKGTLTYIDEQLTDGKTPRHFALDPTGNFLLIGNQGTNQMLLCRIDQSTGRLKPSGPLIDVPSPVCMIFVPPPDTKPPRE